MKRPTFYFLAFLFLVALAMVALPRAWSRQNPQPPSHYSLHVVRASESPWSIMADKLPQVDTRLAIEWLREANGMPKDYVLQPGDVLSVPDPAGALEEPIGPSYKSRAAAEAANREFMRLVEESRKAQEEAEPPQMPDRYNVEFPGKEDTIQGYARTYMPEIALSQAVAWIKELNDLTDENLPLGKAIIVPAKDGLWIMPVTWRQADEQHKVDKEKARRAQIKEASRGGDGRTRKYKKMTMVATAYAINNWTFSGFWVDKGAVATDPGVIPTDSKLWVQDYGFSLAVDTGRDIKGNRIDVYFPTKEEADQWGVRTVEVWVIQ